MRSRLRLALAVALVLVALSACGGSDGAVPTTTVGCKDARQGAR